MHVPGAARAAAKLAEKAVRAEHARSQEVKRQIREARMERALHGKRR